METTFVASLPAIGGAIKIHGEGGARITLDVPDSHLAEALALLVMRDGPLTVTVTAGEPGRLPFDEGNGHPPASAIHAAAVVPDLTADRPPF